MARKGGRYRRTGDGKIALAARTKPAAPRGQPAGPAPAKKEPAKRKVPGSGSGTGDGGAEA